MRLPTLLSLFALILAPSLEAQTGSLDQLSPFSSETAGTSAQGASYNFSTSSLTWQAETLAGFDGQLEGFELELTGSAGSTIKLAILLGSAWQTSTPVWTGNYSKSTSNTEIAWINVTSANIQMRAGEPYVIQVIGTDTGMNGTGSYESPVNTQYDPPLFLNGGAFPPEWRIGFHTYMLTGPSLTKVGDCGSSMTFLVSGMTPGELVAFAWARGIGNYVVPGGRCAGIQLGLNSTARVGGFASADANGNASLSFFVPSAVCGAVWGQAVDTSNCLTTNVLAVK
ncbi:MAG: hypothetical protein MK209_00115 [Planctomycetes bacterium]|nr:hypothetical protein [Planctomycetota bacterium]